MYWVINGHAPHNVKAGKLQCVRGPFSTHDEAESNVSLHSDIIVKWCPKENKLGAPDIFPFNREEDYPDDIEG